MNDSHSRRGTLTNQITQKYLEPRLLIVTDRCGMTCFFGRDFSGNPYVSPSNRRVKPGSQVWKVLKILTFVFAKQRAPSLRKKNFRMSYKGPTVRQSSLAESHPSNSPMKNTSKTRKHCLWTSQIQSPIQVSEFLQYKTAISSDHFQSIAKSPRGNLNVASRRTPAPITRPLRKRHMPAFLCHDGKLAMGKTERKPWMVWLDFYIQCIYIYRYVI